MYHQKHNGTLHEDYGAVGFNSLYREISKMSIEFSDRYNAMYGAKDVAALLLYMCKNSMCVEQAVSNRNDYGVKGFGADWLLSKIRGVEYDVMFKESIRMICSTVHETRRSDMISKNLTVVIDKTIFLRYDKKIDGMMGLIKYKYLAPAQERRTSRQRL